MNRNNEFLDFLKSRETPPKGLTDLIIEDQGFRSQKTKLMTKFYVAQILGALLSIIICPQFGIGFMDNHGIAHVFRMIGDWACGAFCGVFLVTSGLVFTNFTMKSRELYWTLKNASSLSLFLPGFLWGTLMVVNKSFSFPMEGVVYQSFWIAGAFIAYYFSRKWLLKRKLQERLA